MLPPALSSGKIEAGFWVILFRGPRLLLCGPYYTVTIVLYDSSCNIGNIGTSDLPEIYAQARGSSVSAYISGKSQVPMLQLIYSTWVIHLQVWGNCRNSFRVYLFGTM